MGHGIGRLGNSSADALRAVGRMGVRVVVGAGWTLIALALLLGLTSVVEFPFSSDTGIVSLVTLRHYPIRQELFWCYATTVGVPLVVLFGYVLCRVGRLWQWPLPCAGLHFPLLLLCIPLYRLNAALALRWGGVGLAAIGLALVLWSVVGRLRCRSVVVADPTDGHPVLDPTPMPSRTGWVCKAAAASRWIVLLLPAAVFLYMSRFDPHIRRAVDLFHEGEYLVPLQEAWLGAIPYRDIYLQHGLFHNLGIPWLAARLFGYSLGAVRTLQALLDPLGWVGAYVLLLGLVRGRLIPALLFAACAACMPTHVLPRAFFGLCSLGLFAGFLHRRGRGGLLMLGTSGLLASLAFLHSVEIGLYTLATAALMHLLLLAIVRDEPLLKRLRAPLVYGVGCCIPLVPFLYWLGMHGAIDDLLHNLRLQLAYQLEVWGLPFANPLRLLFTRMGEGPHAPFSEWIVSYHVSLFYAPLALCVAGLWLAVGTSKRGFSRNANWWCLLLLAVAGNFYFRTNLGRSDGSHYHYGYMIGLLFAVYVVDALVLRARALSLSHGVPLFTRVAGVPYFVAAGLVVMGIFHWMEMNQNRHHRGHCLPGQWVAVSSVFPVPPDQELIPPAQWTEIQRVAEACQGATKPDDPIYDFSNQCGYLFFAQRRTASRYFMPVYAPTPSAQAELVAELQHRQPPVVIYSGSRFGAIDGIPTARRIRLVGDYLREAYQPWRQFHRIRLWKRVDDATRQRDEPEAPPTRTDAH